MWAGGATCGIATVRCIGTAVERAIVSPDLKEPRKFASKPTVIERWVPVASVPATGARLLDYGAKRFELKDTFS